MIAILLVPALLAFGFPAFVPDGMYRGGSSGLKETVMSVMNLAQTPENPSEFSSKLRKTITAFRIAAGIKTVIRSADSGKKARLTVDNVWLMPSDGFSFFNYANSKFPELPDDYRNFYITPPTQPPEA